ncbi:bifunctional pyr operon transcriptional regulator/uracil phosphoribosyltransferase PyrR [Motiliproteus sp.]|uniref:bifunctional pyr operon transcriptional regulator/uracil phosphoribosyltransferase PyrR n=1 Tax=Motiliproteus sp. TaxID=1898955 RepID=UPI003BAC9501
MPERIDVEQLLAQMTEQLKGLLQQRGIENPMLVGIRTGGVWLAERVQQHLGLQDPVGVLDISFYRDDFTRIGLNPKVQPSALPFATEERDIVLIDDVLMSGRTVRAALNELFDYGRPASVTLMTLLDLQAQELPIQADIVGKTFKLEPGQQIKLSGPEPLSLQLLQRQAWQSH